MGNGRVIRAGEVQYMSAGTGVLHSEFNPAKDEAVHLLQIWILPDHKNANPRYAEKSLANAPAGKLHLVTSKTGRDNSVAINQDANLYFARLNTGDAVSHVVNKARHVWLHVAEGEVDVNGDTLKGGDAVAVSNESLVKIASAKPSQVLLFDLN